LAGCKARCAQGDGDSCANVAYLYESNRYGVKPDKALAAEYFSKACDLGRAASCTTIGLYYDVGIGVDKNYGKAATLFQKACDGGHPSGCESLADLYVAGRGVDKNGAKAVALYEPICRTWSQACWKLGAVYEKGDVVPRNDAAAAKYYSLGCDDKPKFYPSCYAAGTMYERGHGVARSKPRALEYYRIACHQGRHREACEKL
jgi:hypothetical protein